MDKLLVFREIGGEYELVGILRATDDGATEGVLGLNDVRCRSPRIHGLSHNIAICRAERRPRCWMRWKSGTRLKTPAPSSV